MVPGTVIIKEYGGVAGRVTQIRALTSPQTKYAQDEIAQHRARVEAYGTLMIPVIAVYGGVEDANASRATTLTFVVDFTDDKDGQFGTGMLLTIR
jgi:hypothetical protein